MKRFFYTVVCIFVFQAVAASGLDIKRITYNDYNDWRPQVNGSYITWYGTAGTSNTDEIFLYNITSDTIQRITTNATNDRYSRVSSTGNVAWEAWRGPSNEYQDIYFYNSATGTSNALISNTKPDYDPQIDGNNVIWYGNTIGFEIFYFNGTSTTQMTNRPYVSSFKPQLENNIAVWSGYDDTLKYKEQIYYHKITENETYRITASSADNFREPQISGSKIAYIGASGMANTDEIYYYDITSGITVQVTDNAYVDNQVRIDGNYITWHGAVDGSKYQVYLYDTLTGITIQLSEQSIGGYYPDVDEGRVAWTGMDGNIYVFDIATGETIQVTNTPYNEASVQVCGNVLTWEGHIDADWEIFMTSFPEVEPVPEPLSAALLGILLICGWITKRIRR
ncbi:MAG: WD40 repeat domain-containing protein [Candidatus Auribacterota bacterium]